MEMTDSQKLNRERRRWCCSVESNHEKKKKYSINHIAAVIACKKKNIQDIFLSFRHISTPEEAIKNADTQYMRKYIFIYSIKVIKSYLYCISILLLSSCESSKS